MIVENIEKIIALICNSRKKICLFLGAGVDISSGGKTFENLKKDTLTEFTDHRISFLNATQIDDYFEQTIDSLPQLQSREILLNDVNTKHILPIQDGYKLLVLMAKYGFVDAVITTNFFDNLERAQQEMGESVFEIWSNDEHGNDLPDTNCQKTLYLKLHGDINDRHVTHVTRNEIDHKSYSQKIKERILLYFKKDLIIFIGYGGFDTKVTELVKSADTDYSSYFWINPTIDASSELVEFLSTQNAVFGHFVFDEFMIHMGLRMLKDITLDAQSQTFIDSWLRAKALDSTNRLLRDHSVNIERAEYAKLREVLRVNIVSGESGIGKTYLIKYYVQHTTKNDVVYIDLCYCSDRSAISEIVSALGFQTETPFSLLYSMCCWYQKKRKFFTVIIDGLSEDNTYLDELTAFVNAVSKNQSINFILITRGMELGKQYALYLPHDNFQEIKMQGFSKQDVEQMAMCYNISNHNEIVNKNCFANPLICALVFSSFTETNGNQYNVFDMIELALSERLHLNPQLFHHYLVDIAKAKYEGKIVAEEKRRYVMESGLISEIEPYYFKYEVFTEYYLQCYLFRNQIETKNSIIKLHNIFESGNMSNSLFYNACMLYYSVIYHDSDMSKCLFNLNQLIIQCRVPVALKFCQECVLRLSQNWPKVFCDTVKKYAAFPIQQELSMFILGAIQELEDDDLAYSLYSLFETINNSAFVYEAIIYSIDRFCEKASIQEGDINARGYFDQYADTVFSGKPGIRLFKLMYALMRTDVEKQQYPHIKKITDSLRSLAHDCPPQEYMEVLHEYSYSILFNSGKDLEADYAAISYMYDFLDIINCVLNGKALTSDQYLYLISITNDINNMCVFLLSNLVVVQSMVNNRDETFDIAKQIINNHLSLTPQNIDFLLSSVFMGLYHCDPQNRSDFVDFFDTIYRRHEMVLFEQPSSTRKSTARRFSDEFDRIFEDGFNPLAILFYTSNLDDESSRLHQYWEICDHLCASGNISKILKIIHALGQMVSLFPREGFQALHNVTKYNHEILNRGILRVLQENTIRYPRATSDFIKSSHEINEMVLFHPCVPENGMMLRNRTLEQLHWSRFLYCLKLHNCDLLKKFLIGATKTNSLSHYISYLLGQENA